MLSDDSCTREFFAGSPPPLEGERGEEGEGEGRGREREEESVGDESDEEERLLQPPKTKKSRSQVRALDVQTHQVCLYMSCR